MIRDRQSYARRRMSLAVDRQIVAGSVTEKAQAGRWVLVWAARAGIRKR